MKRMFLLIIVLLVFGCGVGCSDEVKTSDNKSQIEIENSSLEAEELLIVELKKYIKSINLEVEIAENTFETKLNSIKNDKKLLYVEFDSKNYYYACAYLNADHNEEDLNYCCIDEYEWCFFEDEKSITKYHNEKELIIAFQINKSCQVRDILLNTISDIDVEHYQVYTTLFEEDINVNSAIDFNKSYIYVSENKYYCEFYYDYKLSSFSFVNMDNTLYILVHLSTSHNNGEVFTVDLQCEAGKYYNKIIDIMISDKYNYEDKNGNISYYGIIDIKDIKNILT